MRKLLLLALAVGLLFIANMSSASGTGSNSSLSAGVTVQCPFSLKLHAHPVYSASANQIANFTVFSLYNCSISSLGGSFSLLESNGTAVYTLPISGISVTTQPYLYNIPFNASSAPAGTYTAKLQLSYDNSTNSSSTTVLVNKPDDIAIVGFSTSPSILLHSLQSFYIKLNNTGSFAFSNSISVSIHISGPKSVIINGSSNYSLSPSQNLTLTFSSSNSTSVPGSYLATLNVTYPVNKTLQYKHDTIAYAVTAPSTSVPTPKPWVQIPQFSLLSFPYLISLISGKSQTGSISIRNNGNTTEYVNVSVPADYSSLLSLSATNLSIPAGQTIGLSTLAHAPSSLAPGRYVVPLNITASIARTTATETLYMTIEVSTPGNVSAHPIITLVNNTNGATGTVEIINPTQSNLTNVAVKTVLPGSITSNISLIGASGLPYSISKSDGSYVINWHVSNLPKNSSTYAYFSLANITSQNLLSSISEQIEVSSVPAVSSILKVVDIDVPTFYVGTENTISLTFFYSGASPQTVSTYLTGPLSTAVYNSSQSVNAAPNGAYTEHFGVKPSSTGTAMLSLYIGTQEANLSYSIPILVLAQPVTTTSTTTIPQVQVAGLSASAAIGYGLLIAILLVIALIIIAVAKSMDRPKYDPGRAERLRRLRESIKRV